MPSIAQIQRTVRQLLPTGRAFKMPFNGYFDKLQKGLAQSELRAWNDGVSLFDSILPDNNNFTADDATRLERAFGMINGNDVDLSDRKLAIRRKINHPGDIPARQYYLYQQAQLQAAGFNVYVHENLSRINPSVYASAPEHGDFQHGDFQHGIVIGEKIANKIEIGGDNDFTPGTSFSNVYFIGGQSIGEFASIQAERRTEFRELVLRLKPQNQVAYVYVNYI